MITVAELIDRDELPLEFLDCLPEVCDKCGTDLWLNEGLTGLCCGNPRCGDKLVMRMQAVCTDLNILGLGENRLDSFIQLYKATNPLDILTLPDAFPYWDGASIEVSKKIKDQVDRELKKPRGLYEVVQLCHIPGLQTQSKKLFKGYTDMDKFLEDLEAGGVVWVQDRLGIIGEDGVSLTSIKIYENILEYAEDLREGSKLFPILGKDGVGDFEDGTRWDELPEITVVISDSAGGRWAKKKDFMAEMQERFAGRARIEFLGSVNSNIDALVWAGADGSPARMTSKVTTVQKYQEKGKDIPILTGEGFEEWLEGKLAGN